MTYVIIAVVFAVVAILAILIANAALISVLHELYSRLLQMRRTQVSARFVGLQSRGWCRYFACFETADGHGNAVTLKSPLSSLFTDLKDRIGGLVEGDQAVIHARLDKQQARIDCLALRRHDRREAITLSSVLILAVIAFVSAGTVRDNMRLNVGPVDTLELGGRLLLCSSQRACTMEQVVKEYVLDRCERGPVRKACTWKADRKPRQQKPAGIKI